MKKRDQFKTSLIALALLPFLLVAGGALLSSSGRAAINRHMTRYDEVTQALVGLQPRDYAFALLAFLALSSVIIVWVLFTRTMIDRVAPPFDISDDDETNA